MKPYNLIIAWIAVALTADASAGGLENLPERSWYEVPNSRIVEVMPPRGGVLGITYPRALMTAWNGGAFDSTRNRLVVWGGGHNDSGDNSIYAFDLDTLRWERVFAAPTNPAGKYHASCSDHPELNIPLNATAGPYPDGSPIALHTYDGLEYAPNADVFFVYGSNTQWRCPVSNGVPTSQVFRYNFSSGAWHREDGPAYAPNGTETGSAFDPVTGTIWGYAYGGRLSKYNPLTSSWEDKGGPWGGRKSVAAIDPVRRKLIQIYAGGVRYANIDEPGILKIHTAVTVGNTEIQTDFVGAAFDSGSDRLVAWKGGTSVYVLDNTTAGTHQDPWVWTRIGSSNPGEVPDSHPALVKHPNGVHGRFRYSSTSNVLVVVNAVDANVMVYRLSAGKPRGELVGKTITTVAVREKAGQTTGNYPLTFGHVFKRGDVPAGRAVQVANLATQFECKRAWEDGSCKHAVVSVLLPQVTARQELKLDLNLTDATDPGGSLGTKEMLATDVESRIELENMSGGGTVGGYAGARYASLREAISEGSISYWLKGPVSTEILARQDIPDAAGRDQLNGYWEARFYPGTKFGVRVATAVENVESDHRANVAYDLRLKYGFASPEEKYRKTGYTHYADTRWRKVYWVGAEPPEVEVRYDLPYWISTGLVPSYDASLTVAEETLAKACVLGAEQGSVGWGCWLTKNSDIDGAGFVKRFFGATGGRPEIGLLPKWEALYLLSMDNRMRSITLSHSEISGLIPIHVRDASTGKVMSLDTYPNQQHSSTWPPPIGAMGGSEWRPDRAHQPSLNYLAYLITGERWHVDELYAWANWNMLSANPGTKSASKPYFLYRGLELGLISDQVRGEAWAGRNLGFAGAVAPDSDPWERDYFIEKMNNNIAWWNGTLRSVTPQHMQNEMPLRGWGYSHFSDGDRGGFSVDTTWNVRWTVAGWMEDFCAVVVRQLADMGFPAAETTLERFGQYIVGRFSNQEGWNRYDGANYYLPAVVYDRKLSPVRYASRTATFAAADRTLRDVNASFVTQGFRVGDKVEVLHTQRNSGARTKTVAALTETSMQFSENIVDESPRPDYFVELPSWSWSVDPVYASGETRVTKTGADFSAAGFSSGMTVRVAGSAANDGEWTVARVGTTTLTLIGRKGVAGTDPGTVTFSPQVAIELSRSRDASPIKSWAEMAEHLKPFASSSFLPRDYPYHYQFQGLAAVASVAQHVPGGMDVWRWMSNTDGDGRSDGVDEYGQELLAADPTWALVPRPEAPRAEARGPSPPRRFRSLR